MGYCFSVVFGFGGVCGGSLRSGVTVVVVPRCRGLFGCGVFWLEDCALWILAVL